MEKSVTISELAKALVSFQKEMKTVVFDASNPFFKSKYATLAALVSESKDLLAQNNLAISQLTEDEGAITTILMHTSGEYLMSKVTLKPVKDDPQGRGSCITYSRRYSYASILGLVSDNDDDGNEASATHVSKNVIKDIEQNMPEITTSQLKEIKDLAKSKFLDVLKFNEWLKKEHGYVYASNIEKKDFEKIKKDILTRPNINEA